VLFTVETINKLPQARWNIFRIARQQEL